MIRSNCELNVIARHEEDSSSVIARNEVTKQSHRRMRLPRCARNGGLPRSLQSLAMTIYCMRLFRPYRACNDM